MPRTRTRLAVVAAFAWAMVMVAAAGFLINSQATARQSIRSRLQTRIQGGAEFASLYVNGIFAQELTQARTWLSGHPTEADLRLASAAVGSRVSVLLDARGRLLTVLPAKPQLLHKDLASRYQHLREAIDGQRAVSNVVPSAAQRVPVVAFALPFRTRSGLRVFSSAFGVAKTPLGAYISHLLVTPGRRVYLIDGLDHVIATSNPSDASTLDQDSPTLSQALQRHSIGTAQIAGTSQVFDSTPVAGTPWRVVATVPAAALYSSVDGAGRLVSWIGLAALTLSGFLTLAIVNRLARSRERLIELSRELDRLARLDSMTGVNNRRALDERLNQAVSASARSGQPLAVLMVDIDHFKQLNDTHGHQAGDIALVTTAARLGKTLRAEDILGRWGGEEFLVILPNTDLAAAASTAERLRRAVSEPSADSPDVTATIGVASFSGESADHLIARADGALYAGKRAGRNRVELARTPLDSPEQRVGSALPATLA